MGRDDIHSNTNGVSISSDFLHHNPHIAIAEVACTVVVISSREMKSSWCHLASLRVQYPDICKYTIFFTRRLVCCDLIYLRCQCWGLKSCPQRERNDRQQRTAKVFQYGVRRNEPHPRPGQMQSLSWRLYIRVAMPWVCGIRSREIMNVRMDIILL
jgi:hypothetical protein